MDEPNLTPALRRRLMELKAIVAEKFDYTNWHELAFLTGSESIVDTHPRLLRALGFGDDDYETFVLPVLGQIVRRDPHNFSIIEQYLEDKFQIGGELVSTTASKGRRVVFTPSAFDVPDEGLDMELVAVMMPFSADFDPVFAAIKGACDQARLKCLRVSDIWEHSTIIQDVFTLIFRANIVVCDFTGKNPNVFYECGIAHTLGKQVVPLSQFDEHVPFDLRHHRYLRYLSNGEGLAKMSAQLAEKLRSLAPKSISTPVRRGGREQGDLF